MALTTASPVPPWRFDRPANHPEDRHTTCTGPRNLLISLRSPKGLVTYVSCQIFLFKIVQFWTAMLFEAP